MMARLKVRIKMTDATQTPANGDDDGKRQQAAKHSFLRADGTETRDMHEAVGIRYQDVKSSEVFEYQIPGAKAGDPLTMLAVFGAKTKATNEASQVRQAEARGDDTDGSQVDAIIDVFAKISEGTWREVREGGVGAKVDRDALAAAIVEAKAALGLTGDLLATRQKLDDDVAYFRKARKAPDVTAIYNSKVGKTAKPVSASDL